MLAQLEGPTVPDWGGTGDPQHGYYAGLPGRGFAKILQERWTELTPSGAYWNPTRILSDNRIAALAADTSTYVFAAPPATDGPSGRKPAIRIEITLLFRRAFKDLMDQKGWDVPDILMDRRSILLVDEPIPTTQVVLQ
jgi:hypothetical protein